MKDNKDTKGAGALGGMKLLQSQRLRMRRLKNLALSVLVAASLLLPVWQHFGMERVAILNGPHSEIVLSDDRALGGQSVATASIGPGAAQGFECHLVAAYAWPFCQLSLRFSRQPLGVDVGEYDSISLDLAYQGPGPRAARLYIRNFEPGLSRVEDTSSYKVNEIEFELPANGRITIPLRLFRVATWWIAEKKVPLLRTDMRMDHVSFLELSTASTAQAGRHALQVRQVALQGKLMSMTAVLGTLVVAWTLFALAYLVLEMRAYQMRLRMSAAQLKQLQSLNHSLQLEAKELASQARTDPLTGARNRSGLRDHLLQHWQDDMDDGVPVSLILADIDHFKYVNDTYGHGTGDEVLRAFAAVVAKHIRQTDCLVRWGGEEFLIVCTQTTLDQALRLADKLRLCLHGSNWPQQLRITSSFGVATQAPGETVGAVIHRADKGLYLAKAQGRDRVACSE